MSKYSSILGQVLASFSRKESVKVCDVTNAENIIKTILQGGPRSLQVISDFDYTLTRVHKNGKICESCHGIFDNSPRMPEEFKTISKAISEKYRPIYNDGSLTVEQKIPHMVNWCVEHMEEIIQCHVDKPLIKLMVSESNALLRDNAKEMLEKLNDANIPVLIFSAGIGDVLEEILLKYDAYFPNIKIVSNYMKYNQAGALIGFKEPIIHTMNKNESVLGEDTYFYDLAHRGNAILLGDSDGDIQMASGLKNPGALLKIGFLDTNIEARLDQFLSKYDIVLLDDQSMDFVNLLLEHLLTHSQEHVVFSD